MASFYNVAGSNMIDRFVGLCIFVLVVWFAVDGLIYIFGGG